MHLLSSLVRRCADALHSPRAAGTLHHAETLGHVVLLSATSAHEWGNAVGYACLPILAILLLGALHAVLGGGH